jgi:hypothetical protein
MSLCQQINASCPRKRSASPPQAEVAPIVLQPLADVIELFVFHHRTHCDAIHPPFAVRGVIVGHSGESLEPPHAPRVCVLLQAQLPYTCMPVSMENMSRGDAVLMLRTNLVLGESRDLHKPLPTHGPRPLVPTKDLPTSMHLAECRLAITLGLRLHACRGRVERAA